METDKIRKIVNELREDLVTFCQQLIRTPSLSEQEEAACKLAASKMEELGYDNVFIKDERQLPTGSFKDRQGALTVSYLCQQGITECLLASTGNKAAAYAAFCARAGIRLWIFLTTFMPVLTCPNAAKPFPSGFLLPP